MTEAQLRANVSAIRAYAATNRKKIEDLLADGWKTVDGACDATLRDLRIMEQLCDQLDRNYDEMFAR